MLNPINKSITVQCNQKQAFTIFVNEVQTWWPLNKNSVSAMSGEVAKKVVIEPKLGGEVYEIGHDDTHHTWGSVVKFNPYSQLTLNWHIGLPADNASEVDVQFIEIDAHTTRVDLTHSRWEAFGDKAEAMRDGYNQGWVGVFEEAFKNACAK